MPRAIHPRRTFGCRLLELWFYHCWLQLPSTRFTIIVSILLLLTLLQICLGVLCETASKSSHFPKPYPRTEAVQY